MPPVLDAIAAVLGFMTILGLAMIAGYVATLDSGQRQDLTRSALRSARYFLPSDFTDGALGVASARVEAPDLWTLVKMSPGQVATTLGLNDKKHARKVIDSLVNVLQHEFSPAEIYVGGSFKKNNALKSRSDIDLVMKLNDFTPASLPEHYTRAVRVLWQAFGRAIDVVSEPRSPFYVLSFFVASGLQFDLVFTGLPDAPNVEQKFRSASTSYLADNAIKSFGARNTLFQPLALLCKHWAYQTEPQRGRRPKSYFVELFVMETIRRFGNDDSMQTSFLAFLALVGGDHGPVSVQNLNPNATPKFVSLEQWEAFTSQAWETWALVLWKAMAESRCVSARWVATEGSGDDDAPRHGCQDGGDLNDFDAPRQSCLVENAASYATMICPQDLQHYFRARDEGGLVKEYSVWQGDHRYVCKGTYERGERRGQACVVKWFKSGDVYEERFYQSDLLAVRRTADIVDSFNVLLRVHSPYLPCKVLVNSPGVWTMEQTCQLRLVEPYLDRFTKFNSNTAQVDESFGVMQALSHYSFHISDGQCLVCDVQGQPPGAFGRTYTLTDPVICSRDKRYGPTDLGVEGMENFFYYHKCNGYCRSDWSRARGVPHFRRSWGSLMAG